MCFKRPLHHRRLLFEKDDYLLRVHDVARNIVYTVYDRDMDIIIALQTASSKKITS